MRERETERDIERGSERERERELSDADVFEEPCRQQKFRNIVLRKLSEIQSNIRKKYQSQSEEEISMSK